ncbi:MAG: hypothetical protein RML32_02265, partial [Gammaproteobacteria bacterium]|nr:hypothetical protein [Gammaproteobacteria bacterium]
MRELRWDRARCPGKVAPMATNVPSRGRSAALWLLLGCAAGGVLPSGYAAERPRPEVPYADPRPTAKLQPLEFESTPAWMRRLDHVARHGWAMVRLRRGAQVDLVFGAHPDGYIGVFTTLP